MRIIAIALLALSLCGCASVFDPAQRSILTGGPSVTASVDNPVTPQRLAQIEQSLTAVMAGLVEYRRLCIAGTIPATCRDTIVKIQPYTKQAKIVVRDLRVFVKNNQQISAITAFNSLKQLIADINAARGQ